MAQGQGSYGRVSNGQDTFGGHLFGVVDYTGPASYVQGGDGPVDPKAFGFENTILALWGSVGQGNLYFVIGRPLQNSTTPWQLVWYNKAGGEVAGATNLSGVTVRLSAIGY
jgi:hypothetical protein